MFVSLVAMALASTPFRLPATGNFTRPHRYDLALKVLPAEGAFSGEEAIAIEVVGQPTAVVLNAVELELSEVSVEQAGKRQAAQVVAHPDTESVELKLAEPLVSGDATVHLKFQAPLRTDLRGLYLVKAPKGELYAVTQFEATDARRAFPCYDEPGFRAAYAVTATVPAGLTAVSNGAAKSDVPAAGAPGLHTVVFDVTPPISSYLVALAVGKFGTLETDVPSKAGHLVHVRVVAPAGQEKLGKFALELAVRVLPFYEDYFGLPYPFQKLDMVAIPDFDAGGMENAGAIFYREKDLLLADKTASVQSQKRVGVVVVHEIAHQWFGDLVTMAWWDDLWLNEAFASLMEGVSLEVLHPEWDPWADVESGQLATLEVLETDSLSASHPIHVSAATAEEANALFDDITYSKGEAVLRMLQLYLTPKLWQAGVHAYLSAHALGNATGADLWEALSAATGKDVGKVAASWFDQAGFPLVSVSREGRKLTLSQSHFVAQTPAAVDDGVRWQIPVCLEFPQGKMLAEDCTLLGETTGQLELGGPSGGPAWVDANAHQAGFYRVDYDGPGWNALIAALDKRGGQGLDPFERMALLSNAYWLARTDRQPLERLLSALAKLGKERDFAVWTQALHLLGALDRELLTDKDRESYRAFVAQLLRPIADELGWSGGAKEVPTRRALRGAILQGLVAVSDPRTLKQARAHLAAFEAEPQALDLNLLPVALSGAARQGDAALWESFRKRMESAPTPELREDYRLALSAFREPALIQKTLALTLSRGIPQQDVARTVGDLLASPDGGDAALEFLFAHWGELKGSFTSVAATWHLLPQLGSFCSAEVHDRLSKFVADPGHKVEGAERPLQRAIERIGLCAAFRESHQGELSAWLSKRRR